MHLKVTKQMQRLQNYCMKWFRDYMRHCDHSEMSFCLKKHMDGWMVVYCKYITVKALGPLVPSTTKSAHLFTMNPSKSPIKPHKMCDFNFCYIGEIPL